MLTFVIAILVLFVFVFTLAYTANQVYFKYSWRCFHYLIFPPKKEIEKDRVAVNNFFNLPICGDISKQYELIRNLGIKTVRVLFAWSDGVQPRPNDDLNFSFYDSIVQNCPDDIQLLPVVSHTPSWFLNEVSSTETIDYWLTSWFEKVVKRYAGNSKIIGYEVWNEPDVSVCFSNSNLCLEFPERYIELLRKAKEYIRQTDNTKLCVMAATTSIQKRHGLALEYNQDLLQLGIEQYTDLWNIHLYGEHFEELLKDDGLVDFLKSIKRPIWLTETGCVGHQKQLEYFRKVYSFMMTYTKVEKLFYYILTDSDSPDQTYGLVTRRTEKEGMKFSDLYHFLLECPSRS